MNGNRARTIINKKIDLLSFIFILIFTFILLCLIFYLIYELNQNPPIKMGNEPPIESTKISDDELLVLYSILFIIWLFVIVIFFIKYFPKQPKKLHYDVKFRPTNVNQKPIDTIPKEEFIIDNDVFKIGGMSILKFAYSNLNGEKHLAKIPRRDGPNTYETCLEKLKIEAEVLSRCNHPNIVKYVDSYTKNNEFYLITEFVEGKTLDELFDREENKNLEYLTEDKIKEYIDTILHSLNYLHDIIGIIHRDINPSNIMLNRDGRLVLFDFGTAKKIEGIGSFNFSEASQEWFEPKKGTIMYTKGYTSPEQELYGIAHKLTDIYGVGATMYFLATGYVPQYFQRQRDMPLGPFPKVPLHLRYSEELIKIIEKATENDPEKRYQSGGEMGEAIEETYFQKTVDLSSISERGTFVLEESIAEISNGFALADKYIKFEEISYDEYNKITLDFGNFSLPVQYTPTILSTKKGKDMQKNLNVILLNSPDKLLPNIQVAIFLDENKNYWIEAINDNFPFYVQDEQFGMLERKKWFLDDNTTISLAYVNNKSYLKFQVVKNGTSEKRSQKKLKVKKIIAPKKVMKKEISKISFTKDLKKRSENSKEKEIIKKKAFLEKIKNWKSEGYEVKRLEGILEKNNSEIENIINKFQEDVNLLKDARAKLDLLEIFINEGFYYKGLENEFSSIKSRLNDPDKIDEILYEMTELWQKMLEIKSKKMFEKKISEKQKIERKKKFYQKLEDLKNRGYDVNHLEKVMNKDISKIEGEFAKFYRDLYFLKLLEKKLMKINVKGIKKDIRNIRPKFKAPQLIKEILKDVRIIYFKKGMKQEYLELMDEIFKEIKESQQKLMED